MEIIPTWINQLHNFIDLGWWTLYAYTIYLQFLKPDAIFIWPIFFSLRLGKSPRVRMLNKAVSNKDDIWTNYNVILVYNKLSCF